MSYKTVKDRERTAPISEVKATEYRSSLKKNKKISSLLTLAIILLFAILCYSAIISLYFHLLWLEILLSMLDAFWIAYLARIMIKEKRLLEFDKAQLDENSLALIKLDIYHYYKKLTDILYYSIPVFWVVIYGVMSFSLNSGELAGEISYQIVLFCSIFAAILLYMLVQTILMLYCGVPYVGEKQKKKMKKMVGRTSVACSVYWIVICGVLLSGIIPHHFTKLICAVFAVIYLAAGIIINVKGNQHNFSSRYKKTVAVSSVGIALLLVVGFMYVEFDLLTPYATSYSRVQYVPDTITYNAENGNFTVKTEKEDFKILQLSDIHLGGSPISLERDKKALDACYKLISDTKPDMVVVTGDMVFSLGIQTMSFNNYTQVSAFCKFMESVGIPWAFTYGNHDTEFLSTASKKEIDRLYLSASFVNNGVMLYPDKKPDISGRCNQCIEIRNGDGSLRQALFLIDSNACTGVRANVYDGAHEDQVEWYESTVLEMTEREGTVPNSIIYTHIPPYEVKEAYELSKTSPDKAKLLSGRLPTGIWGGKITTQFSECRLFDSIVRQDSTSAVFFGHDHFTTLDMIYEDVRLCYGLSIDYTTRPGAVKNTYQRGGTLVTLKPDTTYTVTQKLLTDIDRSEDAE